MDPLIWQSTRWISILRITFQYSVASTAKLQLQLPALDGHEGRAYEILVEGLGLKILELEVIVGGVAFRLRSLRFRL